MLNSTEICRGSFPVKDDVIMAIFQGCYHEYAGSLFIARGGAITCVANGSPRYLVDLPHRGLMAPYKL